MLGSVRLLELLGTLSLAADAGMGLPSEQGLRAATIAVKVGELAGATPAECRDAMYLSLLRYVGCTSDSDIAADVMGDEIAVRGELYGVDWGAPLDVMPRLAKAASRGKRGFGAVAAAARTLSKLPGLLGSAQSHCEVGDRIAERLGFAEAFRSALFATFERWDGRGWPRKLRGEAIPLSMRLAQLGEEIEIGQRAGGAAAAVQRAKARAGRGVEPRLVECFEQQAEAVCGLLDVQSQWTTLLALEPEPVRLASEAEVDEALSAMGHFADLKSRFTRGHSSGVAALASAAARQLRLPDDDVKLLERAALVHDLGRVAVSAGVWDKPGPLTDPEWERVRLHTYVGERILSRSSGLAAIAGVATLAHERLDGSGYHRRLAAASATPLARILAAADVFQALTEDRAYRPRFDGERAVAQLSSLAAEGRLCPDAVACVCAAAGQAPARKLAGPSGLTERELEVLRLVARGLTNKEIANELAISNKTAGNHLQNIFGKIGVTTRAAATLFAMQRGLL
jgi:HD-GYP domain-containing protein (c-di-GMP phosphodiesterase class II)